MTYSIASNQIHEFLEQTFPFNQLKSQQLHTVTTKCQLIRYRTFQPLFVREFMPTQIAIIYEGKVRLLGYDQCTEKPASLQVVGAGEILGWVGLVRGVPCEIAIASTEVICIMGITQSWEKEVPHYLEDRDNSLRSLVLSCKIPTY